MGHSITFRAKTNESQVVSFAGVIVKLPLRASEMNAKNQGERYERIAFHFLRHNDCVNAAGALYYDFRTDVVARSRSTLGSSGFRASSSMGRHFDVGLMSIVVG